jgi:hypothetical protein
LLMSIKNPTHLCDFATNLYCEESAEDVNIKKSAAGAGRGLLRSLAIFSLPNPTAFISPSRSEGAFRA